ncbi:unnamed protein product [Symbiodinium sp. CCMP2592]|nr:unnamed protein product [Symbiodinium sp. CCMP2592]
MGVEGDLVQGLMRRKQASLASTAVHPPDWYRAGAYTAPPPAFADEATKALQAIAKAVTSKDEAASQERGKLSSVGKVEERCLYLVRGCDSLTVPLGEATVGKELFHALRNTATQDRPLLRSLKFPINITNRFAFGVSGLCVGGKGNIPEYSLTTGDFPATSEAEFDSYSVPGDIKLEKKPRAPATLTLWYRNALRQCWALACIFGVQHYGGWERAASGLLRMAEETAHAWPLHLIISTWDELWSRFMEEVRDIERKVRREMGEEAPSFERLKFFCTAPGVDGNPWLRLPQTFELEDPLEYFQTDVLPRQRRILERTCWQLALKGPQAGLAGGRAGEQGDTGQRTDTVSGPKVGANTSAPALLGKPLSNKEVQRSMDHRPKCQRTGKYFCWDAMSRRGCHAQSCAHSHEKPIPGWHSLDFSVQMQLLRRGGHLGQPKMSGAADVDKAVAVPRKAQADKVSAAVAEGKAAKAKAKAAAAAAKVGAANSTAEPSDTRAGWAQPPPELGNFFATDLESGLAEAMAGSALDWTANHSSPPLRTVSLQQSTEATRKREADMANVESSGLVPDVPPTLACYLRNRLLHVQGPPGPQHVQQALDDAVLKGAPELAVEAEAFLAKVGDSQATRATLTRTSWVASSDAPGSAQLSWGPHTWDVLDYGDTLAVPAELEGILEPRDEPQPDCEPRQCLLLHVAAACLWAQAHVCPSWSEVRAAAAPLRVELHGLACQAAEALSFEPGSMTRAERDLRVFIHDLLYHGHDKDYRCLAAFPPSAASHLAIQVVRLDSWKRPTVERLAGASAPLNSPPLVWLLVHEGHMRLLVPTSDAMPAPARSITMHGWDVHLEAASVAGAELVPPAKCPRCDAEELRRTGVSTSVLGLYPVVVPTERAGSVRWESSPPSGPAVDPLPVVPLGRGQAPWAVLELALGTPSALAASADASWGTIGLAAGQDLAAAVVRQGLLATLRAHQPPLSVVSVLSPELTAGSRLQPGCSGLSSSLLSFVALLLQEQRSRAGDVLFLHPLTGAGWRHESILTALQGCPRVRLPLAPPGRAPLLVATTASAAAESLRTGGTLSTAVSALSAAAAYLDAVEEAAQFSKEGLRSVAAEGSLLLRAAGGWQEAMRAIKRTYIQRHGDHFEGLHGPTLDGLVPPPLLERARHVAVWGVEAQVPLKESARLKCAPHPSLKAHMDEAAAQLWKDVVRGRVLVCYDQGEGLDGVISVPMARVPKMNPDRTVSDKGRVVWDATPVNRFCTKEDFPPALQPKHREVARVILYWGLKFPGVPILLSKKDVSDAFKWLPVALADTKFFAADLPASYVEADHDATLLYGYMTFGWRGAPGEYMGFAWVLKAGHEAHGPSNGRWEAADVAFHSFVLMDDTVLVEPDIGLRPWVSVEVAEQMTRAALGPRAINPEKDAVEGALETRKLIWGLTYDTGRGTVSLPIVKIEKAYHLLHLPQFDHGNRVVPLRLVQELRGNQQFWLAVFPSLAPYLGATNDLLGPPDDAGNACPKGPDTQAIELQRVLVDSQGTWEARFSHSLLGALTLPEYLSFPGLQDQVVWASGDATTQVVGAIDWEARVAVVEPVKDLWAALREFLSSSYLGREDSEESEGRFGPGRTSGSSSQEGDEESFSPGPASEEGEEDVMISLAELLAVLCLVAARWRAWSGKVVVYAGDNQNVVRWIAAREASPPAARFLLQILGAAEAVGHFRLYAEYIRTYHNVVADDLTRKHVPDVLRENNLERIEGRGTMVELLDRSWANRALLWATMEDDDRGIALQLCLRIHELALGPPVYTRELTKEGAVCTHQQRLGTEWKGLGDGWFSQLDLFSGRSFGDQVWWRRWALVAVKKEPVTLPLARYNLEWRAPEAAKQLLEATPPSFAHCFSPGPEEAFSHRAGVCFLPWEEHTRRALMAWMEERDSSWRTRVGGDGKGPSKGKGKSDKGKQTPKGGKGKKGKGKGKGKGKPAEAQIDHAVTRILRHAGVRGADGGNLIFEEGWVSVTLLVSALRQEPAATELEIDLALLQRLEHTNSKSRFVLRQADPPPGEDEGAWYAAAWAGHTLSGVVGPGAIATPPPILLHGTYRSKVPPIQLNGLLPLRRALHLQDPSCKSGRWRSDLEVAVTVDAVKAAQGTPKGSSGSQEGQPPGKESRKTTLLGTPKGKRRKARLDLKAYQGGRPSPKEPTLLKDVAAAAVALGATLEDGQEVIVDADTWQVAVPEAPEFEADVDFGRSTSESGSEEAIANAAPEPADEATEVAHTYSGEWSTPDGLKCLLCNAWIDGGHLMTPIHNRRMRWHLKERARQSAAALSTQLKDLTLETPAKKQRQQSAACCGGAELNKGPKLPQLLVLLHGPGALASPNQPDRLGLGEGGLGAAPPKAGSARGSTESLPATGNQERQGERGTEDRFGPGAPEAVLPDSSGAPSKRAPSFEEQMAALDEEERILLLEAGGGLPSESSSGSRPLVPRTGIRLTAPKVGLLRAISDADTRNWKSLSAALKEAAGDGGTKAQLVLDLERLASQRKDASRGAKGLLEDKVRDLKALETSDSAYLKELDSQDKAMRELERQNPVRPSLASKPLSSDRLTAAIKSGTPIWVARKQEKGRIRAQEHRARIEAEAARERAERPPGAEPTPRGEALDERMKEAARLELREFRALLAQGTRQAKRPPDSTRRRKLKKKQRKERLREKARNDDADRDTNHAIAHARDRTRNSEQTPPRSEGRFGPGRSEGGALTPFTGGNALSAAGAGESGRAEAYLWETGLFEGFLLGVVACLWAQFCWRRARGGSYGAAGQEEDREHDDLLHTARKPYGGKVEVKFLRDEAVFHAPSCNLVRPLHKAAQPCRDCGPEARWGYLADLGPRNHDNATRDTNHAYAHLMLIGVTFFLLGLLGSCLWGQPSFPGVIHKALEQGGSEECFIPGPLLTQCENEREDEARCGAKVQRRVTFQKMEEAPSYEELAGPVKNKKEPPFLGGPSSAKRLYGSKPPQLALPLATREAFEAEALRVAMDRLTTTTQKAYQGQLKWWRLFCLRRGISWLLSGSEPSEEETHLLDFLLHTAINGARAPGMQRQLGGYRLPVTPTMLAYLFTQLWENAPHEAPGLWLALCLGYFFLLRASEFLPVPYLPDSRHLKGTDLRLRKGGQECDLKDLHSADEVVITLRGSKTDRFNRGTTRNHFRGVPPLCPVDAAIRFFSTFPARHGNGEESGEPLLRGVTRECIQMLIAKAAEHQGMQGATGAHSLRFGGASAIWAAYQNSAQLQRFGRWASDVYHGYIWDARASSKGVAKAMAEVDVQISGLRLADSPMYQVVVARSQRVQLEGLRVSLHHMRLGDEGAHNTDGVSIIASQNVLLSDSVIESGDDNVVVKEGSHNVACHGLILRRGKGVSIGSLGERGAEDQVVTNISFHNVTLDQSMHGARIKTWKGAHGLVKNVTFSMFKTVRVVTGILIDQTYCPPSQRPEGCAGGPSDAIRIEDVHFRDFVGTFLHQDRKVLCSLCSGVTYEGISLQPAAHEPRSWARR